MADTIALSQAAYWPQQLNSVVLQYALDAALPTTGNVLAFVPQGGSPSWEYQIPFAPTSGSGTVTISGTDPRVPWSQPGYGGQYNWIIALKAACGAVYAQTTMQIVPPPTLANVTYNGTSIKAQFVPVGIGSPTKYTLAVTTGAGTQSASTNNATQLSVTLPVSTPLTAPATFTLTTVGTDSNSSTSNPLPLLVTLPVLDFAAYDGACIRAQWQTVPGATEYLMFASSTGGKQAFQMSFTSTQGTMPATGMDATYSFVVMASATPQVWASTEALAFMLNLPQNVQASYDGANLTAQWTPTTGAKSYTVQIFTTDQVEFQGNFSAPQAQLAAVLSDTTKTYLYTAMGNADGMVSAALPAIPFLLNFPTLISGTYDGAKIVAQWQMVLGASGYVMRAYSTSGGPSFQANAPVPLGTLPAPSLSTTVPYLFVVFATCSGYVTPTSQAAPITTQVPQLSAALYDQVSVQADWTQIAGGYANGYTMRVYSPTGESYSVSVAAQFSSATVELAAPLNAQGSYFLQLLADTPGGISSMSQQALLLSAPEVSSFSYDGAQIASSWTMPTSNLTITGLQIRVFSPKIGPSFESAVLPPSSLSGAVTTAGGLDPTLGYLGEVIAQAGIMSCSAAPAALLAELPVLRSASYDGATAGVSWYPVLSTTPASSGYKLISAATTTGGTTSTSTFPNATVSEGNVAVATPGSLSYAVQVCAVSGIVHACSPTLGLVQSAPTLSRVAYDGRIVSVSWSAVSGATNYILQLLQGGGVIAEKAVTATSGSIAMTLDPAQVCSLSVRAVVGATGPSGTTSIGPPTIGVVLAMAPALQQLTYDANAKTLVVTWSALTNPPAAATGLGIGLYSNGELVVPVGSVASSATTYTFTSLELNAWQSYSVQVWATGTNLTGPPSLPGQVIAAEPEILSVDYDAGQAAILWAPLLGAGVTGYQATLTPSTGTAIVGTTVNSNLKLSAPPGVTYTLSLLGFGQMAAGPATAALALISEQVILGIALYDGSTLQLQWSAATTTGATYQVEVYAGSALLVTSDVAATQTSLSLTLDPTVSYSAKVRVVAGSVTGPRSASIAIISALPRVSGVTTTSTGVTVTLDISKSSSASGVSGYQVSLYQDDVIVAGPTATTTTNGMTSATLTYAVLPQCAYSVVAQAIGSDGTKQAGPPTASSTVISGVPSQVLTTYDGTNSTVTWSTVSQQGVTGYAVVLTSDSTPSAPVYVNGTTATFPAPSGKTNSVQVQAIGNFATGPATAAVNLVGAQPTLSTVSFDGNAVQAAWSAVTGATGYKVAVMSGGSIVASTLTGETSAALPLPHVAEPLTLTVAALVAAGGKSFQQGPYSSAATLLMASPVMGIATTDVSTSLTAANWDTVTGAASYSVQLYVNGAPSGGPVPSNGTQYVLPEALAPGSIMAVAAAAVATSGGATVTGPFSIPSPLPSLQPVLLSVDYDGVYATVTWTPASGATGYKVYVLNNADSTTLGPFAASAGAIRLTFMPVLTDLTKAYSVAVQAVVGASTGIPSTSLPLFQPSFFVSTQPATTYSPYLNPAWNLEYSTPANLVVYLPQIAATGSLSGLPVANTSFSVAANTSANSLANFPYTLQIPTTSAAWTFSTAPVRQTLQNDYVSFLQALETAGASPAGILLVMQAISRAMPQTFQETLYYAYGLNLLTGCADLRPGMVLRIAFTDFQNLGTSSPQWQTGYTGAASVDFDVSSYLGAQSNMLLGFDSFIAQLVGNGAMQVTAPASSPPSQGTSQTEAGLADSADLFYPSFCQPFFRLFFPAKLEDPTTTGSIQPARNFTVSAAATYTLLAGTVNYPTGANALAYFRGRVVVKLCIRILVNGVEEIVPIGTTVGNLLDRYGCRPPATSLQFTGLSLQRALGPAIFDGSAIYQAGASMPVRLNWNTLPLYGASRDSLSLPLLHGDRISLM